MKSIYHHTVISWLRDPALRALPRYTRSAGRLRNAVRGWRTRDLQRASLNASKVQRQVGFDSPGSGLSLLGRRRQGHARKKFTTLAANTHTHTEPELEHGRVPAQVWVKLPDHVRELPLLCALESVVKIKGVFCQGKARSLYLPKNNCTSPLEILLCLV